MPDVEALRLALKLVEQAAEYKTYRADLLESPHTKWVREPVINLGWNQGQWITVGRLPEGYCLTAGCLAGHVAMHDGYVKPWMDGGMVAGVQNPQTGEVLTFGNEQGSVKEYALQRLGLDADQAECLFRWDNTLDDLRTRVDELCLE